DNWAKRPDISSSEGSLCWLLAWACGFEIAVSDLWIIIEIAVLSRQHRIGAAKVDQQRRAGEGEIGIVGRDGGRADGGRIQESRQRGDGPKAMHWKKGS